MNDLGLFSLLAGALQLTVPSYALRLIRRFGVEKVGWFIVSAFVCLGISHLFDPLRNVRGLAGSGIPLDAVYAIASVLLLIGMAHLDTLVTAKMDATTKEKQLQADAQKRVKEEVAALQQTNEQLAAKIVSQAQRERALEESEARYRLLFVHNPQAMWVVDLRSCRFLAVNKTALAQYGFSEDEFMAAGAAGLVSAESRETFLQDMNKPCSGVEIRGCWSLRKKDGTLLETEITATDMKYAGYPARLVIAADLTARHREREELLEKQRLQLIGKIAGGVAHHFNNILTVISTNTELLQETATDERIKSQLAQISTATHRAACLTRQLLGAGGEQLLELGPLNLNLSLKRLTPTLQRLIGDRMTIENRLAADLPLVLADSRALESIVVGVVLNARDAMSGRGTLILSTKPVRVGEFGIRDRNRMKAGEFVCLAVRDTGCGMTQEMVARLFEPFFTTKDLGKATGLGLASAYGLAKQQSGWIECISEARRGTEIKLFLPCAPTGSVVPNGPGTKLSTGTVLLIESDDRARALARYILNRQGYIVIECDGAEIALSLWESVQSKVDLVLTELALPGTVSGAQLVQRLQSSKPNLKAAYISEGSKPLSDPARNTITKPYSPETLLEALEKAFAPA